MSYPDFVSESLFEPLAAPPIRVGVIGTGFGASLHLSAMRENPDFVTAAICSRRPERARAAALDHGIPTHGADYRALVRDALRNLHAKQEWELFHPHAPWKLLWQP